MIDEIVRSIENARKAEFKGKGTQKGRAGLLGAHVMGQERKICCLAGEDSEGYIEAYEQGKGWGTLL